jgi:lysozyme family protein/peptidoglycan hydrolase-like protein with peptidoglycan-binding domain
MSIKFEDFRDGYTGLWSTMTVRPDWTQRVTDAAKRIFANKNNYHSVESLTGVHWFVVALIHQMEAGLDFGTHLHNGDPLTARTCNEPVGRPLSGRPPFLWSDSAADAIRFDKLDQVPQWTLERVAFQLEKYNGFRSRTEHHINTPYLWSGTNHYDRGKFVRDNVWSDTAVSKQVGAMPIFRELMKLDASMAEVLKSEAPLPAAAGGAPGTQPPVTASDDQDFDLKELQRRLQKLPLYRDEIDGICGPHTRDAIKALLITRQNSDWLGWSASRLLIAGKQALCDLDGIEVGDIDGILGPQTQYAFSVYAARSRGDKTVETWRDEEEKKPPIVPPPPASNVVRPPAKAATVVPPPARASNWPRQSETTAFYGEVGQHQTKLVFPYPVCLAWETSTIVKSTSCHEKVHDAALRILTRVLDHYGLDKIRELRLDRFGGCLNVRRMRGGSAWSMHSWGIAFDFDPDRNQLRWGRDKAAFARPEYEKWFELWEEEGAISLGRTRNFDWMHTQFARL